MKEEVKFINMRESKGKLKQIYVMIHVDKEGNEGILAMPAYIPNHQTGALELDARPEITPYEDQFDALKEYAANVQKTIGDDYIIKIKKFTVVTEPGEWTIKGR